MVRKKDKILAKGHCDSRFMSEGLEARLYQAKCLTLAEGPPCMEDDSET